MLGRPILKTIVCGALCAGLVSGCGGGSSTSSSSSAARQPSQPSGQTTSTTTAATKPAKEKLPTISLPLKIPIKATTLPARYTCDGADVSPPFTWSEIPSNTVEIDLFIFNVASAGGKQPAAWGVAGIKPTTHGLAAGQVPPGAILGRNQFGQNRYSLCPPKGTTANYVALLVALPSRVPAQPGFEPEALSNKAAEAAEFEGRVGFSYKRA